MPLNRKIRIFSLNISVIFIIIYHIFEIIIVCIFEKKKYKKNHNDSDF